MECAEIPLDEPRRLDALYALNILDTAAEERFDRVTRLVRRTFKAPIALVTLVDAERQWFKSREGLDISETSRDISFCAHVVHSGEALVVPDTCRDSRFADNPLVTAEPHIRFYAGCPLHSSEGYCLGTLCLMDTEPRTFEGEELVCLTDLAKLVEQQLQATQLHIFDELTGLPNRRGFAVLADKAIKLSTRHRYPVTFAGIDLDGFKAFNDRHGRAEGDRLLKNFAAAIRENFRETDLFARVGSDEFAIMMTGCKKEDALNKIHNLRNELRNPNCWFDQPMPVSFRFGIVQYRSSRHVSMSVVLADLDKHMYWLKDTTALGRRRGNHLRG